MQKIILTVVSIVIAILTSVYGYGYSDVFASHGNDTASCTNDGLYDGKNNPFSHELFKMCGDTYTNAFIEGCISVEGNTKDVCESATDAD